MRMLVETKYNWVVGNKDSAEGFVKRGIGDPQRERCDLAKFTRAYILFMSGSIWYEFISLFVSSQC